jgi:hypothetical protein
MDKRRSEKLTWAFSSGELKVTLQALRLIIRVFSTLSHFHCNLKF